MDSLDTTAAQQDLRNKREEELKHMKKVLEEETIAHGDAIAVAKKKHNETVEEMNNQIETLKKVRVLVIYLFIIKLT